MGFGSRVGAVSGVALFAIGAVAAAGPRRVVGGPVFPLAGEMRLVGVETTRHSWEEIPETRPYGAPVTDPTRFDPFVDEQAEHVVRFGARLDGDRVRAVVDGVELVLAYWGPCATFAACWRGSVPLEGDGRLTVTVEGTDQPSPTVHIVTASQVIERKTGQEYAACKRRWLDYRYTARHLVLREFRSGGQFSVGRAWLGPRGGS